MAELIELVKVSKWFETPAGRFEALKNIDLVLGQSEFVALVGKSGCGKSTLLNMMTGIDRPSDGTVGVNGTQIQTLSENELAIWRGKNLGIVFQFFQLLPTLTVVENVMLPMDLCHTYPSSRRRERALSLLAQVGVAEQADKLPSDLSGGQQQRTAIARALANDPPVIVADEPTGNLDSQTSDAVLQLFADLTSRTGKTVVMATHERNSSTFFTRTVRLSDGMIFNGSEQAYGGKA